MKSLATRTTSGASPEFDDTSIGEVRRHVAESLARIEAYDDPAVWIFRTPAREVEAQLEQAIVRRQTGARTPLLGMTAAVKDNIDVVDMPTTCACPRFSFMPNRSASVVRKLIDAGAVVVGKANLDQFATGLVGVRSPFGACRNVYDRRYISGGSSSGSAVAVAAGLVDFALGTDTAGSGRVPAAFNNVVGLKPTRGLLSTSGVFPACRSLDCVSIFARDLATAATVFDVARGFDENDAYSRHGHEFAAAAPAFGPIRIGVPAVQQLEFFGNTHVPRIYRDSIERLVATGAEAMSVDFTPFRETAQLLYGGPWVAERYAAVRSLIEQSPDALLSVTRQIIEGARRYTAADAFEAQYRLLALKRRAEAELAKVDALLLPTAGTTYTIAEVEADPLRPNQNLGYYTNFVNLLDLCAIAVPAGFGADGLPVGVSLVARAGADGFLLELGQRFMAEGGAS